MIIKECPYCDKKCGTHAHCKNCEMVDLYKEQAHEVGCNSFEEFGEVMIAIMIDDGIISVEREEKMTDTEERLQRIDYMLKALNWCNEWDVSTETFTDEALVELGRTIIKARMNRRERRK